MSSALVPAVAATALTICALLLVTAGVCVALVAEDCASFDSERDERSDRPSVTTWLAPERLRLDAPGPGDWRVNTAELDAWRDHDDSNALARRPARK